MSRFTCLLTVLIFTGSAAGVSAQETVGTAPAPNAVEVSSLAAPDAFTTPGRETGLPSTLWRGASVKTARTVLPLLAAKTLSPVAAALARRVLATGGVGPEGAGSDPILAAARAGALTAQGDPRAAAAILARVPGVDRSPELAHAAAESALLTGNDARACAVAEGLSSGREDSYWLRLRSYCQAIAGHPDQAQLTFDLAQSQAKDVVFGRMMSAKLAGSGDPGPASLRNGLDYALSHSLGLDLTAAKASVAVAAALSAADPTGPTFDLTALLADIAPLAQAAATRRPLSEADLTALMKGAGDAKAQARAQGAILLELALEVTPSPKSRGLLASLAVPEGRAPVGRNLALDAAGNEKLIGEAAILALWTCAEAGPAGLALGDRIRIVHVLQSVGLEADARAFALEGFLALK